MYDVDMCAPSVVLCGITVRVWCVDRLVEYGRALYVPGLTRFPFQDTDEAAYELVTVCLQMEFER